MLILGSYHPLLLLFVDGTTVVGMQDCPIELAWLATLQRRRAGEWRD
jgi:hypothetical protein